MFSPLEQFEIEIYRPLSFFGIFDISLTNSVFVQFFVLFCFFLIFFFAIKKVSFIPTPVQYVAELSYIFIFDMIKVQSGLRGQKFFPLFFLTFFFIFFCNLLGLTSYAFTVTSHLIITYTLASVFFIAFTLLGFWVNGLYFLKLFVPKGVPVIILPLVVVIEIASYFIRPISLSVRLFANMLAGHTLLHIIGSFTIVLFKDGLDFVASIAVFLLIALTILEIGIAFIQAYVFVILLAIYLNDSLNPGH